MEIFLVVVVIAVIAWFLVLSPTFGTKMDKWTEDPLDFDIRFNPYVPEERALAEKLKEHYYGPRPEKK